MATRKIELWKMVEEAAEKLPDKLIVDPLDIVYFDRLESYGMFNEMDQRRYDDFYKVYEELSSKLDASLNDEQKSLLINVLDALSDKESVELYSAYKFGYRDGKFVELEMMWGPLIQYCKECKQLESELKKIKGSMSKREPEEEALSLAK